MALFMHGPFSATHVDNCSGGVGSGWNLSGSTRGCLYVLLIQLDMPWHQIIHQCVFLPAGQCP